jgi:hypothetical protein
MQRTRLALVALAASGWCSPVYAEQFVLADIEYTHSTATTKDSHYYPDLPANTPKNWKTPVDYAGGFVHIVVDVKSKPPGGAPTKLQICFEGTPSYACTTQSETYTTARRLEWDSPVADFWYESTVDWAQGTKEMPFILKDDANNKPHGDPEYMPTELHVQVTLVSKGSTFVPPPPPMMGGTGGSGGAGAGGSAGSTSGTGGAGAGAGGAQAGAAADAGVADPLPPIDAGGERPAGPGGAGGAAGAKAGSGGSGAGGAAGQGGGAVTMPPRGGSGGAGASAPSGMSPPMAGSSNEDSSGDDAASCRVASSDLQQHAAPWPLLFAAAYLMQRRRRTRAHFTLDE